ncbi:hypothetical protein SOVF_143260, partial [Spinacia oleracea]
IYLRLPGDTTIADWQFQDIVLERGADLWFSDDFPAFHW